MSEDLVNHHLILPRELSSEVGRYADEDDTTCQGVIVNALEYYFESRKLMEENQRDFEGLMLESETLPSFGWSDFALKRHRPGSGCSYSILSNEEVLNLVEDNWHKRIPGNGETTLDRKVLVPVDPKYFVCSSVLLTEQMKNAWVNPIKAKVGRRQEGEDLRITHSLSKFWNFVQRIKAKPEVAKFANIVCYSREALLENGGTVSTNCDWEIVALLASPVEKEPMHFLTMARNMLEKPGGTKGEYTAQELVESIYYWSQRL